MEGDPRLDWRQHCFVALVQCPGIAELLYPMQPARGTLRRLAPGCRAATRLGAKRSMSCNTGCRVSSACRLKAVLLRNSALRPVPRHGQESSDALAAHGSAQPLQGHAELQARCMVEASWQPAVRLGSRARRASEMLPA